MVLETPLNTRTVLDYDIIFESGMVLPITVDPSKGDTIEFDQLSIKIHLAAKPSLSDPDRILPAEDTTIFVSKVACVQRREKEITELNPEQKEDWQRIFDAMANTRPQ